MSVRPTTATWLSRSACRVDSLNSSPSKSNKLSKMTAVDWDEVKRLAADFQKAQLSSTLQRFVFVDITL